MALSTTLICLPLHTLEMSISTLGVFILIITCSAVQELVASIINLLVIAHNAAIVLYFTIITFVNYNYAIIMFNISDCILFLDIPICLSFVV